MDNGQSRYREFLALALMMSMMNMSTVLQYWGAMRLRQQNMDFRRYRSLERAYPKTSSYGVRTRLYAFS